jgi:acyl-CoA thioester hydrolase
MSEPYTIEFKVRDYECDLQGIVNNAVYQNYLEHARHEFLLDRGVNFAELSRAGINLVVVRAELDYKKPLTSGDRFSVSLSFRMLDRVRFEFHQTITKEDKAVCLEARIIATALNNRGRPSIPKTLSSVLTGQ